MRYLKRYESFYNEDFKVIKEELGKRESEEDENGGDEGFASKDNKAASSDVPAEVEAGHASGSEGGANHPTTQSADVPAEVEAGHVSGSEGGSGHPTAIDSNPPKEVMTSTFESSEEAEVTTANVEVTKANVEECSDEVEVEEAVEAVEAVEVVEESVEDSQKKKPNLENSSEEAIDEGSFRKWATGHESSEERDDKMVKFQAELDKLDAEGAIENPNVIYNREAIERKAKENNYKGGIRVAKGGRDKSKVYVIYDDGYSGFQSLAGAAGGRRRELIG